MGNRRKKRKTHVAGDDDDGDGGRRGGGHHSLPKCIIIKRGKVSSSITELVKDMRIVMSPYSAISLKESSRNTMKDFVSVAGPLGVTHFQIFTTSDNAVNFRIGRLPHGPTLTFHVTRFSLCRDVVAALARPHSPGIDIKTSPLAVLNNFSESKREEHLVGTVIQTMFPAINVQTVKLGDCRRVVLFDRSKDSGKIEFRHYAITTSQLGLSKSVKQIVQKHELPDLSEFDDIGDYVEEDKDNQASDSDVEDTQDNNKVRLPSSSAISSLSAKEKERKLKARKYFKNNNNNNANANNTSANEHAVKLIELGPRMELELIKIEDGFCGGDVMYHSYIEKTAAEVEALRQIASKKSSAHKKLTTFDNPAVQNKSNKKTKKLKRRAEKAIERQQKERRNQSKKRKQEAARDNDNDGDDDNDE